LDIWAPTHPARLLGPSAEQRLLSVHRHARLAQLTMETANVDDPAIADRHATARTPSHRYPGQATARSKANSSEYSLTPWHGLQCSSLGRCYTKTGQHLTEAKARVQNPSAGVRPGVLCSAGVTVRREVVAAGMEDRGGRIDFDEFFHVHVFCEPIVQVSEVATERHQREAGRAASGLSMHSPTAPHLYAKWSVNQSVVAWDAVSKSTTYASKWPPESSSNRSSITGRP
jgi:hypothetical protein